MTVDGVQEPQNEIHNEEHDHDALARKVLLVGANYQSNSSGVDASTETIQTIIYGHHKIHDGNHYFVSGFESENNGGTIKIGFKTPDTAVWAHVNYIVKSTSRAELRMYEGATYTGGASVTPVNNDRNSNNTSDMTLVKDPTVTDNGTLIASESTGFEGTSPNAGKDDGLAERESEIILKQDTYYVFEVTSRDDGNIISYRGQWYEHENKN